MVRGNVRLWHTEVRICPAFRPAGSWRRYRPTQIPDFLRNPVEEGAGQRMRRKLHAPPGKRHPTPRQTGPESRNGPERWPCRHPADPAGPMQRDARNGFSGIRSRCSRRFPHFGQGVSVWPHRLSSILQNVRPAFLTFSSGLSAVWRAPRSQRVLLWKFSAGDRCDDLSMRHPTRSRVETWNLPGAISYGLYVALG